jgi:hypothetical protein
MDDLAEISFLRNLAVKDENAMTFGLRFSLMLLLNLKDAVHGSDTPHRLKLLETRIAPPHFPLDCFVYSTENTLMLSPLDPDNYCLDYLRPLTTGHVSPDTITSIEIARMKFMNIST